jgi:hypothetical protein
MDWDKLKERVVTTAILATLAAAIPTYVKVEAQTKQLDLLQAELKEQKAEVRRLYENIGDLVTELMRVSPKAYNEPAPRPSPASLDPGIMAGPWNDATGHRDLVVRQPTTTAAAAAAAPPPEAP